MDIKLRPFRRFRSNLFWIVLNETMGKGALFVTNVYLARKLGTEAFGYYSIYQSIVLCFWLAADLGTGMYAIREIARDRENCASLVCNIQNLRFCSGFATLALFEAMAMLKPNVSERETLAYMGLYLLFFTIYPEWILRGLEQFKYLLLGTLVSSAIYLIGVIALVNNAEDLKHASWLWSTSFLFAAIALFFIVKKLVRVSFSFQYNGREWLNHVKKSIWFSASGGLLAINLHLPIILLNYTSSVGDVGAFSAVYRTVLSISNAGVLIPTAMYPIISQAFDNEKEQFYELIKFLELATLSLGLLLAGVMFLFSNDLVVKLFGRDYSLALNSWRILVWLVPLRFLRYVYGYSFGASNKLHFYIFPLAISTCIVGLAVLVARNFIGLTSISYIVVSGEAFISATSLLMFRRISYSKSLPERTLGSKRRV